MDSFTDAGTAVVSLQFGVKLTLFLMFLLAVKHFICDFPLQAFPYMYKNKGTYGHFGGLLHALIHGVGTFIVFMGCFYYLTDDFSAYHVALYLAAVDSFAHYHIDWAKMNFNAVKGWKADTHEEFWIMVGFDQFLHTLTYIGLILLIVL